ncbi:MAG: NAD-dependent epimerase/dehydratase family protein [Solirubrobacteraceae bacterium]
MTDLDRVLITGAAGRVGGALRAGLRGRFRTLRLLDRTFAEPADDGEELYEGDLRDPLLMDRAVAGCDAIVHLAAIPDELASFSDIMQVNIGCTHAVLEAARVRSVRRLVIASTSRVTGMYPRDARLDTSAPVRPDTLYAVSKVACEALARLYAERFGLEIACLRIGSYEPQPTNTRHLSTWVSPRDLAAYVHRCLVVPGLSYTVLYAVSDNRRTWWDDGEARRLGIERRDDAERFAAEVAADDSPWPDVQGLPAPESLYDSFYPGTASSEAD